MVLAAVTIPAAMGAAERILECRRWPNCTSPGLRIVRSHRIIVNIRVAQRDDCRYVYIVLKGFPPDAFLAICKCTIAASIVLYILAECA